MNLGIVTKSLKNLKFHLIGLLLLFSLLAVSKQYSGIFPVGLIIQLATAVLTAILAEWAFFGNIGAEALRSAVITGMLCGMILMPGIGLHIIWLIVSFSIASKLLFRTSSGKHIFNPAAVGLVLSMFFFENQINWWGFTNVYIVIVIGGIIIYRLNRLSLVFSYIIFSFLSNSLLMGGDNYQIFRIHHASRTKNVSF